MRLAKRQREYWNRRLKFLEKKAVSFYRDKPFLSPDGSFMRYVFRKGYEAAMRAQKRK